MTPSLPRALQIGSRQVAETLRKLAAEVGGLKAFEPGVREAIGNTNWTVLMQRLDEADAALSRIVQAPVAVKPLEWEAVEGLPCTRERAQALGGEYEIVRLDGDDEPPSVCFRVGSLSFVFILEADPLGLPGDRRPRQFASVDAAKAAAQADFDKRIRSALLPSSIPAPADGWGEALELSGISGELIDAVAAAIRADGSDLCDQPWEQLSEDHKIGWRGDAMRAIRAVKDHLRTASPSQPVADAVVAQTYRSFTDGMQAAAEICGSLAETTYDDADGFEAATGCEEAIMKVVREQRAEQAALPSPAAQPAPMAEGGMVEAIGLTEYELQVLLGTSIHGCNMSPDRVFSLPMAWHRLYAIGLIDRPDGLAIITEKGRALVARLFAALRSEPQAVPDGWRAIETAPKDGTNVLGAHDRAAIVVYWQHEWTVDGAPGWATGETDLGGYFYTFPVTHWRVLPPLPSAPVSHGGEHG